MATIKELIRKQKNALKWMDEPIKADQWHNLYFLKNGKCIAGQNRHPTEEAAFKRADAIAKCASDRSDDFPIKFMPSGIVMRKKDFSHHMQMPVKE